jgi:amyloid beta precursor protein binding protein 1
LINVIFGIPYCPSHSGSKDFSQMDTESDRKTKKYDRQLRLWGVTGQGLLENASVCLLGCTYTGCETLKNLILPGNSNSLAGIGSFCIIDDRLVAPEDAGSNFFLERNDIGKSIAESCSSHLGELNSDVKFHHVLQVILF